MAESRSERRLSWLVPLLSLGVAAKVIRDVFVSRSAQNQRDYHRNQPKRLLITGFWNRFADEIVARVHKECPRWEIECLPSGFVKENQQRFTDAMMSGRFDGAVIAGRDTFANKENLSALMSQIFQNKNKNKENNKSEDDTRRLRALCATSSGINRIDIDTCSKYGISVTNTATALGDSCATYLLALILMVVRNISSQIRGLKNGDYEVPRKIDPLLHHCSKLDLQNVLVGIVGCGNIGLCLAERLKGFPNVRVCYHNRTRLSVGKESAFHIQFEPSFDQLLRDSDIVVCLVPLNSHTEGMFAAKQFQMMKKEAVFINGARGKLCKTEDLITALKNGDIHAAGLDVVDPEPLPTDHPLWSLPNCVVTPHAMSASVQCRTAMIQLAVDSLIELLLTDCNVDLPNRVV